MAKILSFTNQKAPVAGEMVLVDTSVWYEMLGDPKPKDPVRKQECVDFTTYLVDHDALMVTTTKVHEELRIRIQSATVREIADQRGLDYTDRILIKNQVENDPTVRQLVSERVEAVSQALDEHPSIVFVPPITQGQAYLKEVDRLYISPGLNLGDAAIALTMRDHGIKHLASLDGDFFRMQVVDPELTLFTNSAKYNWLANNGGIPFMLTPKQ